MKNNIIWNAIGSTIYSLISLFLMIIVTRVNGLEEAGIFTYSFSTACILYTIGVYYGRVYQVTENDNSLSDSDFIYNRLTTCIIMIIFALFFIFFKNYSFGKSLMLLLLCIFKSLNAFAETYYAMIQNDGNLHFVGKSMFYKTLIEVFIFFVVDILTRNIYCSILSIIFCDISFIWLYDRKKIKKISRTKYSTRKNILLLRKGFFICTFSLLSIYVINASKYSIDENLSNSLQAIYGIIIMPATIMSLFSQFIIQPYLVDLKNQLYERKYSSFKKMIIKIVIFMVIIGIICIFLAYYIGLPILSIIYGISLEEYSFHFLIIMVGSLFYGLSVLISFILIAMRKNFIQLIILIIISILAFVLSNYMVVNYALIGASFSYCIVMFIYFILYIFAMLYFITKLKGEKNESIDNNCML